MIMKIQKLINLIKIKLKTMVQNLIVIMKKKKVIKTKKLFKMIMINKIKIKIFLIQKEKKIFKKIIKMTIITIMKI